MTQLWPCPAPLLSPDPPPRKLSTKHSSALALEPCLLLPLSPLPQGPSVSVRTLEAQGLRRPW